MRRRTVLVTTFAIALVLAAAALADVLATLFVAGTAAYVAAVPYEWLRDRGVGAWWAGTATTAAVYLVTLLAVAPLFIVLYQRRESLLAILRGLEETYAFDLLGVPVVLTTAEVVTAVQAAIRTIAFELAAAVPVLGIKFTLFGMAVFALLLRGDEARAGLLTVVPPGFHEDALAVNRRVRNTVFALYGLQVATAFGTFLVALPVFWLLGLEFYVTLAVLAGLLQFLPIVGPSILVVAVAVGELLAGDVQGAILVGILGWLLIAFLPDLVIRPRLAAYTTDLPGSLYFIGFAGGLLSLGAVGIIAGPVAIAVLAEAGSLLATDRDNPDLPSAK